MAMRFILTEEYDGHASVTTECAYEILCTSPPWPEGCDRRSVTALREWPPGTWNEDCRWWQVLGDSRWQPEQAYPTESTRTLVNEQTPPIGRIVAYTLSSSDTAAIRAQRETSGHGNAPSPGDACPAMIVAAWGGPSVNLKVFLDGSDEYWATSRTQAQEGEAPEGHWA